MKMSHRPITILCLAILMIFPASCAEIIDKKEKAEDTITEHVTTPVVTPDYNSDLPSNQDPDTVKWNCLYKLQWAFHSEMRHHYIVGQAGNILLVYGHDGGISGYHDHEYLYGLNADTGKKIWDVYGGYLSIRYAVCSESGYIFTGVKIHDMLVPKIACRDIKTGEILWEYELPELPSYSPAYLSSGEALAVLLSGNDDYVLLVFEKESGILLWRKNYEKGTSLVNCSSEVQGIIVRQADRLEAVDWLTGNILWSVQDEKRSEAKHYPDYGVMKNLDDIWVTNKQTKKWFAFKDDFKLVDLKSGLVLHTVSKEGRILRLMPLNDGYIILLEYEHDSESYIHLVPPKKFSLYSVSEKKEIWSENEDIYRALVYNDALYYVNNSEINCVNLTTGNSEWNKPLEEDLFGGDRDYLVQPLVIDNKLIIVKQGTIYMINPDTGERMIKVADYAIDDYVLGGEPNRLCSIVLIGDTLYIGSQGGKVSCLKINH